MRGNIVNIAASIARQSKKALATGMVAVARNVGLSVDKAIADNESLKSSAHHSTVLAQPVRKFSSNVDIGLPLSENLRRAILNKDVKMLKMYLGSPDIAHYVNEAVEGFTPLALAVIEGDVDMVNALINTHAIVDFGQAKTGKTPLHFAVEGGNLDIINILLEAGANPQALDVNGISPIHQAYKNRDLYYNMLFSTDGGSMIPPSSAIAEFGKTDHEKVINVLGGNVDLHRAYLEKKKEINDANKVFMDPRDAVLFTETLATKIPELEISPSGDLQEAEKPQKEESTRISEAGLAGGFYGSIIRSANQGKVPANPQEGSPPAPDNTTVNRPLTPVEEFLRKANGPAEVPNVDILTKETFSEIARRAKVLAEKAAEKAEEFAARSYHQEPTFPPILPDDQEQNAQQIPEIDEVVRKGNVEELISALRDFRDEHGELPLYTAAKMGHTQAVKMLLSDPNQIKTMNWVDYSTQVNPLYIAAEQGHVGVVKALIEAGARTEIPNSQETLVGIAARFNSKGALDVMEILLEAGVDPNQAIHTPPIHHAVKYNNLEKVKLLIEHGADIDSLDRLGFTSLMKAASSENFEMVGQLIDLGASCSIERNEQTVYEIASEEMQEFLRKKTKESRSPSPNPLSPDSSDRRGGNDKER